MSGWKWVSKDNLACPRAEGVDSGLKPHRALGAQDIQDVLLSRGCADWSACRLIFPV
jgi:hypothetical protein